jgi:hypothetical protein
MKYTKQDVSAKVDWLQQHVDGCQLLLGRALSAIAVEWCVAKQFIDAGWPMTEEQYKETVVSEDIPLMLELQERLNPMPPLTRLATWLEGLADKLPGQKLAKLVSMDLDCRRQWRGAVLGCCKQAHRRQGAPRHQGGHLSPSCSSSTSGANTTITSALARKLCAAL